MIFTLEHAKQILAGKKTQARIPTHGANTACRYKRGHTYAVQPGAGRPALATIRILGAGRQRLSDVTAHDAAAEGFETLTLFLDWFSERHNTTYNEIVWALVFEITQDEPRLLLPASRGDASHAHERGYTSVSAQALREEPEAVSDEYLTQYAADAGRSATERVAVASAEREQSSLCDRVQRLQQQRNGRPVDIGPELRVINQRLERAERQLGQDLSAD